MFKQLQEERGAALLIALSLMMCLFMAITVSLNSAKTDIDLSFNQINAQQAFYVAEAGVNRAEIELSRDMEWVGGFDSVEFSGGSYAVTVITDSTQPGLDDTIIVRAVGSANGAVGMIEEWLVPDVSHPFKYALFAKDRIDMMNNATTNSFCADSGTYAATQKPLDGDIGSNGVVVLQENVKVNGDVSTAQSGGITINKATVTGDTTTKATPANIPSVPQTSFDSAKNNNGAPAGLSGAGYVFNAGTRNLTMGNNATLNLAAGTYYFNEFHADNNATINVAAGAEVTIYIQKQMTLRNNSRFNRNGSPSAVTIIAADGCPPATNEFIVENNGEFWGSYYGPDTKAWISNNGIAYGSLVAGTIMLDNNEAFHYDRSLAKKKGPISAELVRIAWREL